MDPTEVSIVSKQVVHANHQKANTREASTSDSNDRISIRAQDKSVSKPRSNGHYWHRKVTPLFDGKTRRLYSILTRIVVMK